MIRKTYLTVYNTKEPLEKMHEPGCEPKAFATFPGMMEQLCEVLNECTPNDEQTEIYFGDKLEVTFSANADREKFKRRSKEILAVWMN